MPSSRGGSSKSLRNRPFSISQLGIISTFETLPEPSVQSDMSHRRRGIGLLLLRSHRRNDSLLSMNDKPEVWQGTLALMVLKTLERTGSLHGYGIARQIEQTSADLLSVNYGTLYPALLKLEQEGYISSEWGFSDNNRKAKYYQLTRAGRKQIGKETHEWEQMTTILAKFLNPKAAVA